jgi:hypothetical protein
MQNRPKLLLIGFDFVSLLSLSLFSWVVWRMTPFVKQSLDPEAAVPPSTRIAFEYSFLVYVPLITMFVLTVLNLSGRVVSVRAWGIFVLTCLVLLALVASLWLVGMSSPFWIIPAPSQESGVVP